MVNTIKLVYQCRMPLTEKEEQNMRGIISQVIDKQGQHRFEIWRL